MPVILAEKPSQAKAYAEAFPKGGKGEGYINIGACEQFPQGAVLTWGVGHLVELKSPAEYEPAWKRWSLVQLPMIPERFEWKTAAKTRKQFQIVRKFLQAADEIIIATDCDREGENIARSIIEKAGAAHKPAKRLWINSLEKNEVIKGFQQLRAGDAYTALYQEAQARQVSDWMVGMNASRLYTLLLQRKGIKSVFSVGRVQTPTLKLIYDRHMEIKRFKPEPYFDVEGTFKASTGTYKGKAKVRHKKAAEAEALLKKHGIGKEEIGEVTEVKVSRKKIKPPLLHSLSSLQTTMNKKYKLSPSRTLEIAQSLYDQPLKLITYPRTDSHHITNNEFAYIKSNLTKYQATAGKVFEPATDYPGRRFVDGSKVKEHYAIIPTKKIPTEAALQKLTADQRKVYMEIVQSAIAMFHHDYEYDETTVTTNVKDLLFTSKGKVERVKGWKECFSAKAAPAKKDPNAPPVLPPLEKGMAVDAAVSIEEGTTKPPSPYTEGQLINMMKTCGKWIEEDEEAKTALQEVEGLGTEATRSGIIKTLIRQEYISVQKNIVHVTRKGELLCEAVEGTLLSKPEMTAKWELFLKKIGEGEAQKEAFIEQTSAFTRDLVEKVPQAVDALAVSEADKEEGKGKKAAKSEPIVLCPTCKEGYIMNRRNFYGCTNYSNGCKQTFPKTLLRKTISPAQIKKLCQSGETNLIKGFKGKTPFDAKLKLNEGKVEFVFPAKADKS
ncbi:DNA topoisomerase-3 [Sinobaca qinghaiensis]|uniref:DNA topoisomerase n=1 Tax=Sinobaca qinghaiensis TaxID=342944 RepID=A0A419V489_9BACL|nr:type IA DNA topoisomerase [Sinobaca qinghaiensis]RKD73304.1 DNA topoisomerase-3 [Sinobaca qinghaiensis]